MMSLCLSPSCAWRYNNFQLGAVHKSHDINIGSTKPHPPSPIVIKSDFFVQPGLPTVTMTWFMNDKFCLKISPKLPKIAFLELKCPEIWSNIGLWMMCGLFFDPPPPIIPWDSKWYFCLPPPSKTLIMWFMSSPLYKTESNNTLRLSTLFVPV